MNASESDDISTQLHKHTQFSIHVGKRVKVVKFTKATK